MPRNAAAGTTTADAVAEAVRDEAVIAHNRRSRHQRLIAASVDEDARVNCRRRIEGEAREQARERRLEERTPHHAAHAARPGHCPLERHAPLDHEIRSGEWRRRIVQEQVQQIGRPVERQVRDHPELLAWKRDRCGVSLDDLDVRPAAA
jgi:hypothetical protein